MALVDIDSHILKEIVILLEKLKSTAVDFKYEWDTIAAVREKTSLLMSQLNLGENKDMAKLKEQIYQAMKVGHTKIVVMDDATSKIMGLINHLVSMVELSDTGKGMESYVPANNSDSDSVRD